MRHRGCPLHGPKWLVANDLQKVSSLWLVLSDTCDILRACETRTNNNFHGVAGVEIHGQQQMYCCDKCGKVTPAGQARILTTIGVRHKTYPLGNVGQEIAKEIKVCRTCGGLPERPTPASIRQVAKMPPPITSFCLQLANGKTVNSDKGFELACFLASDGSSITPLPKRKRGGKSKGARGRGRKTVRRTREERE